MCLPPCRSYVNFSNHTLVHALVIARSPNPFIFKKRGFSVLKPFYSGKSNLNRLTGSVCLLCSLCFLCPSLLEVAIDHAGKPAVQEDEKEQVNCALDIATKHVG